MKVSYLRLPLLWVAIVGVHFLLIFEAQNNPQTAPFNDVNLYGIWAGQWQTGQLLGVNSPWVYPFVAMAPILVAKAIGGANGMLSGWLLLIGGLNFLGLNALVEWGKADRAAFRSAFFYLGFLALLGPVAIGRIDAAATFLALLALVQIHRNRLNLAMAFVTLGAWVKIWPVAAAIALYTTSKTRVRTLALAVGTSLALIAIAFILGGDRNVLGFIETQGNRGLQVESTAATFWVWATRLHMPGAGIYFDTALVTNQVSGAFANEVARLLSFVLLVALGITAFLAFKAHRNGAESKSLFVVTFLTATLDLIVFNKVGSPQFELWLVVPLMAGILLGVPKWQLPAVFGLVIALLTNLIYPIFYLDLMVAGDLGVWLLTLRNAALVALLIWANLRLSDLGKKSLGVQQLLE
ncbi:MAG: hypothetical protein ACKOUD_01285 [Rhodoluna sp.]